MATMMLWKGQKRSNLAVSAHVVLQCAISSNIAKNGNIERNTIFVHRVIFFVVICSLFEKIVKNRTFVPSYHIIN